MLLQVYICSRFLLRLVFIGMCTGNVIGPLLYSTDDAPLYRPGLIANLIMFVLVGVISA